MMMEPRLTELNSEPEWDPIAFRGIAAEQPNIVGYCQNTIGDSCLTSDRQSYFAVFFA
jgi:hypothetical protein